MWEGPGGGRAEAWRKGGEGEGPELNLSLG